MNNLPKVVTQQRRGRASNPRLLDRKSDALPLSHRATPCAIEILTLMLLLMLRCHKKVNDGLDIKSAAAAGLKAFV